MVSVVLKLRREKGCEPDEHFSAVLITCHQCQICNTERNHS